MGREKLYAIYDYFDGPRTGVANFNHVPHYFECPFDESADDWSEEFILTPLPVNLVPLIEEDWAIWRRWYAAHQAGATSIETHPALPDDRSRHEEISKQLSPVLATRREESFRARAEFDFHGLDDNQMSVTWTAVRGLDVPSAAV